MIKRERGNLSRDEEQPSQELQEQKGSCCCPEQMSCVSCVTKAGEHPIAPTPVGTSAILLCRKLKTSMLLTQ